MTEREGKPCPLINMKPCPLNTDDCVAFNGRRCTHFNIDREYLEKGGSRRENRERHISYVDRPFNRGQDQRSAGGQ